MFRLEIFGGNLSLNAITFTVSKDHTGIYLDPKVTLALYFSMVKVRLVAQ